MSLINSAQAAVSSAAPATGTAPQGGGLSMIVMLVVFIALIYFLIWRPQSKRAKQHRDLVGGISVGDEVITTGGVAGKVVKVKDNFFVVTVAEGVDVLVQKSAISTALPKGTLNAS